MLTAILAAVFFVVAIIFAMLGQGGGAVYTPAQVLAGVPYHEAATTSLFLIMIVSLSSTLVFGKGKRIDGPLVVVLVSSMFAGSVVGGLVAVEISASNLAIGFAAFVTLAAVLMIAPIATERALIRRITGPGLWERGVGEEAYTLDLLMALPAAFVIGMASGMLGIGGGLLMVPVLVLLVGVPMTVAVGASAPMVGIAAAGGFIGHLAHGHWDWQTSLILAVAVFVGARIGARFSLGLDKARLKRMFGWFLVAIAGVMILKTVGLLPSGSHTESEQSETLGNQ